MESVTNGVIIDMLNFYSDVNNVYGPYSNYTIGVHSLILH